MKDDWFFLLLLLVGDQQYVRFPKLLLISQKLPETGAIAYICHR